MAMKSICARLGAVLVCTAAVSVCSRTVSPPLMAAPTESPTAIPSPVLSPPVLFQLPGGSSVEMSGDKKGSVTDEDGVLSIVGGTKVAVSCRVPWKGEPPKLWRVIFYVKLKDGRESEIAGDIPKVVKIDSGVAEFSCRPHMANLRTTKNCHMRIGVYIGSTWSNVDCLDGITVVKR